MNAAQRRPEHKPPTKASDNMAGCNSHWINRWCSTGAKSDRPDRRIQYARVEEDRRKNTTTRYEDGKPPVVRISGRAIKNCMLGKVIKWINDPNVVLPVLAFFIVTLTTMMAKAGVL